MVLGEQDSHMQKKETRPLSYNIPPVKLFSHVWLFAIPWAVAHQAPPSMGFSRRAGCHFLLQGIFPTQGLNPGLLHCKQILYQLSHKGSPVYVVASISIFIIKYYCTIWIYHILFIHSAINEHMDCFQFGAIVNNSTVNIHVQIFTCTCFYFSWIHT